MVYSERKEFAPIGNKFFPFRVDPFQKGFDVQESKQKSQNLSLLSKKKKMMQDLSVISSNLIKILVFSWVTVFYLSTFSV